MKLRFIFLFFFFQQYMHNMVFTCQIWNSFSKNTNFKMTLALCYLCFWYILINIVKFIEKMCQIFQKLWKLHVDFIKNHLKLVSNPTTCKRIKKKRRKIKQFILKTNSFIQTLHSNFELQFVMNGVVMTTVFFPKGFSKE